MLEKNNCDVGLNEPRLVVMKFLARPQHKGVGAIVRRSIARFELRYFDPFLVLDEFSVIAPSGFPDHLHRGFETVTYMLQGSVTHEDFEGHKEPLEQGLQLWFNRSSKYKMIEPMYQEISSKDIAETAKDGVKDPGSHLQQSIPKLWNAFVYLLEGEDLFGRSKSSPINAHHLLLLGAGDGLEAWNKSSKLLRFILVGGEPLVQCGPFVMNTREEIEQTIDDLESYNNGFEKARHWRSEN
ncbi:Pirin-like protein [Hibiscus syriacus]|uniref:Pirin-like protein n=1 Tax=Hibiscus syriacus TaxID=106335 RepID=A0A6A2YBM7_HIBSY|nr:Pirin-like protein [Hibiscus syriacus]